MIRTRQRTFRLRRGARRPERPGAVAPRRVRSSIPLRRAVDSGSDGGPNRAEEQLLVTTGASLSGTGKGEDRVATSDCGRAVGEEQLLLGAVEAAVDQEPWPRTVGITAGGMSSAEFCWDPPPGQGGVLVGVSHRLGRAAHQLGSVSKAVDGELAYFVHLGVIHRVDAEVELAQSVVVACS